MLKLFSIGIAALIGAQALLTAPAEADHRRHWFYDHYRTYDGKAFDYRRRARIYQRRNFEFELGNSQDDDDIAPQRQAKKHPWRNRRIRYDLSAKRHDLKQRRTISAPPRPRQKPSVFTSRGTDPIEDQVEYSALGNPASTQSRQTTKPASAGSVSCREAREIVAGFGFSDIEAKSCQGKTYSFAAKRDGKPFAISLSSKSGELTQVKRQ